MRRIKLSIQFYHILLLVLIISSGKAYPQPIIRYNTFSYNVNEGLLQSSITDIGFDKNNFCWLSFTNGIQKFDGNHFIQVPVQPGLPDDKSVFLYTATNWDLYIGHTAGISKYDADRDKFLLVHKFDKPVISTPSIIGEDEEILYFLQEPGIITGIDIRSFKPVYQSGIILQKGSPNTFYSVGITDKIVQHKTAIVFNYKIYVWDLKAGRLACAPINVPALWSYFISLLPNSNDEVIFFEDSDSLKLTAHNFVSGTSRTMNSQPKKTVKTWRGYFYSWNNKALLASYDDLFELHPGYSSIKYRTVNFQNQSIGGNSSIKKIKQDRTGNLYLLTLNDGLRKLISHNYPIKYFGTEKPEDNYVVNILPDKTSNRIIAGIYGNGLRVYDTNQHLIKAIKSLPGDSHSFSPGMILKNTKGNYIILNHGEKKAWELSHDLTRFTPLNISPVDSDLMYVGYHGSILYSDSVNAIAETDHRLYKLNLRTNSITQQLLPGKGIIGSLLYDSMIIIHTGNTLYYLDASGLKVLKKTHLENTGGVRCFERNGNNIYVGTNKGIFHLDINGNILWQLNKQNGLIDECIYAMVIDNDGYLWGSTNKGVFKVNKDLSTFHLKKEDGLQENEFNTNVVAKTADGEIYFGGVNGISSFYPSKINAYEEKINLLITKIRVNNQEVFNDTAVWNIKKIELPYDRNSLSFDFIAMAGNNPSQYIYQYRMEGVDEQWIQNKDLQTVRYLLPPGNYVFKITASRFFDKNAKPLHEIEITINPPFWKTWWFITASILLLTTVLIVAINRYNKNKYQRKLAEIEGEYKIQMERERISRDLHDSVGAYANAVLYNIELLQNEKEAGDRIGLMNDLKFASKDIITALRETVWAFKKGEYSAQDCLLRIRNFIHPLSRYYQHINFKVEGEAPAGISLNSANALNLVRIVQEAVTNAIKHSKAKNIGVTNEIIDSKWKLSVHDDGVGFDYDSSSKLSTGNGLTNMKKRAEDSGIKLEILSKPGKGTVIHIFVS